jgi:CrcB protein
MNSFLVVFVGAGIGGAMRHGVNVLALRLLGANFPFPLGTLSINVIGSLAMGLIIEWFALKVDPGQPWRLFITTGVVGGFTTFSAFSLETVLLIERGTYLLAASYVLSSVLVSIGGLFVGLFLIRHFS